MAEGFPRVQVCAYHSAKRKQKFLLSIQTHQIKKADVICPGWTWDIPSLLWSCLLCWVLWMMFYHNTYLFLEGKILYQNEPLSRQPGEAEIGQFVLDSQRFWKTWARFQTANFRPIFGCKSQWKVLTVTPWGKTEWLTSWKMLIFASDITIWHWGSIQWLPATQSWTSFYKEGDWCPPLNFSECIFLKMFWFMASYCWDGELLVWLNLCVSGKLNLFRFLFLLWCILEYIVCRDVGVQIQM